MGKNRYSVVGHYTRDLIFERLGPGILEELEKLTPKDERGNRPNPMHSWLSEQIGVPMLSQHMHAIVNFQRLAIKRGYGWNRFVKMVDSARWRRRDYVSSVQAPKDIPGIASNVAWVDAGYGVSDYWYTSWQRWCYSQIVAVHPGG